MFKAIVKLSLGLGLTIAGTSAAFADGNNSIRATEQWYGTFRAMLSLSDTGNPNLINPPAVGTFGEKNDKIETNGGPAFAIGYNWREHDIPVRTELEVSYRVRHDADSRLFVNPGQSFDYDSNTDALAVMVSAFYDFETGGSWQPYIGGGIGWSHIEVEGSRRNTLIASESFYDGTADNFAWSLQAGVMFDIIDSFAMEVSYRYISLGDIEPDAVPTGDRVEINDLVSHDIMVGTIFKF